MSLMLGRNRELGCDVERVVTMVSCWRAARARATSVAVVPPVSPTAMPSETSPAAASAMRRFSSARRTPLYRSGNS